jgi:hypothetical protein
VILRFFNKYRMKVREKIRPTCPVCQKKPCAINLIRSGVTYYRSKCDRCSRLGLAKNPAWMRSGYKKKTYCEKCGFKSKYREQLHVYHINGRRGDTHPTNLKTICLNCELEIVKSKTGWAQGDLVPDF